MNSPANASWFDRPGGYETAGGLSMKESLQRSAKEHEREGGMLHVQQVTLQSPLTIVRFAETGLPHLAIGGSWWLAWDQYKRVETFADEAKIDIQRAISITCFVPPEWNAMDIVVQARLTAPLMAYKGLGRPVHVNRMRPDGSAIRGRPTIEQLYIPGMGSADVRHDAVALIGYGHLPTNGKMYRSHEPDRYRLRHPAG